MPSESAALALSNLRDPSLFNWSIIPILVLALYVYACEIERRNWNVLFAGLAYWGVDWFNVIWNGLVFHFTGYAPMWAAPADTAFLILIGLNIEICLMFSIMGVFAAKLLPPDPKMKILGVPNRLFLALNLSAMCVAVEFFLNWADALTWDWWFWSMRSPIPIVLFGYVHFFVIAYWVHDMNDFRRQATVVSAILAFDAACLVVFGGVLGWI